MIPTKAEIKGHTDDSISRKEEKGQIEREVEGKAQGSKRHRTSE
jgi:hypothetical protein